MNISHWRKKMWYYTYPKFDQMTSLPFYIVSIGQHDLQPYMSKPEGHPHDQFFYGTKGSGSLKIFGTTHRVAAGCGFFIPANVPHCYYPHEDVWDLRWVSCGGSGLPGLYKLTGLLSGRVYPIRSAAQLDAILNRMHKELVYDKEYGNYFASSYLNEFVMEFARQSGSLKPSPDALSMHDDTNSKNMAILKDYIDYHYMEKITMQDLCDVLLVSPQHLCRIFKICTGKRPTEYINMIRIAKAKSILISSEHSIETVALWCGFENCNYFCKIFKRYENLTPKQYRLQYASKSTLH